MMSEFKVGDRVRLKQPVNRYSEGIGEIRAFDGSYFDVYFYGEARPYICRAEDLIPADGDGKPAPDTAHGDESGGL